MKRRRKFEIVLQFTLKNFVLIDMKYDKILSIIYIELEFCKSPVHLVKSSLKFGIGLTLLMNFNKIRVPYCLKVLSFEGSKNSLKNRL